MILYHIEPMGSVSVNVEQRVRPDLKTTLVSNFLQTLLMSSLIPATLGIIITGGLLSFSRSLSGLLGSNTCRGGGGTEALWMKLAG